jgi:hypothetical protein
LVSRVDLGWPWLVLGKMDGILIEKKTQINFDLLIKKKRVRLQFLLNNIGYNKKLKLN